MQADRYNEGKPQYSLLPLSDLESVVRVFENGAEKYDRNNWKKGLPFSGVLDSMLRHIVKYQNGEMVDEESGQSHMAHVVCNALFLLHYEKHKPEFNDLVE